MANFNLTITNEGAAFLAYIIATQGTINFSEVRFSSTNYVGSEATLTEGTFAGTFITAVPSASVQGSTTINVAASFTNATFTADKSLYSIGVIADDGNGTDYLIAVATTSTPDILSKLVLSPSTYAYNINLSVSSTENITVTASTAGTVFVADIVDNLTSENTNKPLSAKQGKVLKDLIDQHSGGLLPHLVITSDTGSTVTVTLGATTLTAQETSTGIFEVDVNDYGTWTISSDLNGVTVTDTISIDAVKVYTITVAHLSAQITVKYASTGSCSLSAVGQPTQTATGSPYTFTVHAAATYTVSVTVNGNTITDTVVITTSGQTETVTLVFGITFAAATDEEIADMVTLADAGKIDLYDDCGWRVGQEHSISIAAIPASGEEYTVGESQDAQMHSLILLNHGGRNFVTPVLDKQGQERYECSFVVGLKECLNATGYMNPTVNNAGGWKDSARRGWCNNGFKEALPQMIRSCFKLSEFSTPKTDGLTAEVTNDFFVLMNSSTYGWDTNNDTLLEYYTVTANRIKHINDVAVNHWSRCPWTAAGTFRNVGTSGYGGYADANTNYGLSPMGLI